MELVRWEPFAGLGDIRSMFNDVLDENFDRPLSKWYPAVDLLEAKDAYLTQLSQLASK
jgi:hypothetical protein